MKYIFLIVAFVTFQARADFFFIHDGKIYSITTKYSPENTTLDKAHFFKISSTQNKKNGVQTYTKDSISTIKDFTLLKEPTTPKTNKSEGCSQNPMSWIKTSKLLGQFNKKESGLYIQVASQTLSMEKTTAKCPATDRFSEESLQFSSKIGKHNFLICSDDLNYNLLILNENSVEADLTITENCP